MADSEDPVEKLRRALETESGSIADDKLRRLWRLARALSPTEVDSDIHRHTQEQLPALAAAALRGERVAQIFPNVVAHLDVCETCAGEYAGILDDMVEMEAYIGQPFPEPPPTTYLSPLGKLGDWLKKLVLPLVERLHLDDAEGVDLALESYFSWLPEFSDPAALRPAYETAMGFGGEGDQTLLLLIAGGFATDRLLGQFNAQEIRQLATSGRLNGIVEQTATQVAQQVQFERRLRDEFVRAYVAHVQRDPEAFATLFTRPNQAA
jgi:hypothetical protein